jgi:PAS domain S-box-containing protein
MTSRQKKIAVFVAIPPLAAIGVVLDLFTPLGVANWVWYFIPLLLSVYVGNRYFSYLLAAIFSLLMLAGFLFSPPGIHLHGAIINRLMGTGMLWLMAFVIWQRKRAEETSVAQQKLLDSLIAAVPDLIYFKDRESRFIRINEAFARRLRMTDVHAALGKTDLDIFGEHARQAYEDEQGILATGQPMINKEEREDWLDGRVTWATSTKLPLFDSNGKIVGIMGISRDITGRKQAERQLAETLDFNQRIISDAPAGIIVYKASGQCVLANEFAAQTLHATVPQLLKQNFRQLETWRVSGMVSIAEGALATGKPQQCESHFVSTFGREVWLVCNFNPFVRGEEPHLLLLFNDITSRKRAEEHIREQAALLDNAQDAIFVLDSDNHIIYWNKSAERIYGWTAAEAAGKSVIKLLFKGVVTQQLANTVKTVNERGEWVGELQEYTKDGKAVTVQGRGNLIRDEQGRPKSRLIINTDITERKKLEIQFLRSQRMEGIGALAGGIAHDLNNVLSPLLVSVQLLKEKVTDEDGRKLLRALEANVQRGAHLVKQVLSFSRGATGEYIPLQPKHIAHEIKQFIHETFPKSVEFELQIAADLWTITGDPTQLHQVLLNLCVNARDAMPSGGKLSIQMENMLFDEMYADMNPEAKVGPYVCIMVRDNGTGIPREIQDKIFDPFFTTKEPGKGTGLGLSTSLAIVKNHGGFIHCHSTPGKGSRFEVYFPADNSRVVEPDATAKESGLPCGHNELVLVVDDEEAVRDIAQKTLQRFGYRVLLAADGAEAASLYAARQQEIDAVITDMVMPIMDGPAAIVALKTINPNVKIVSSTGMASESGMAKAKDAGVRHFLPKPYTTAAILNTLYEVLNGKQ